MTLNGIDDNKIQIFLEKGKIGVFLNYNKNQILFFGESINDDIWHTLRLNLSEKSIFGNVDDDESSECEY